MKIQIRDFKRELYEGRLYSFEMSAVEFFRILEGGPYFQVLNLLSFILQNGFISWES